MDGDLPDRRDQTFMRAGVRLNGEHELCGGRKRVSPAVHRHRAGVAGLPCERDQVASLPCDCRHDTHG